MSTTVADRTAELERDIARLHDRIRSLESTLQILGGLGSVITKTVTERESGTPSLDTPDGVHVLEHPVRYDEEITMGGVPRAGYWQVRCSCGWESDRTVYEGAAH